MQNKAITKKFWILSAISLLVGLLIFTVASIVLYKDNYNNDIKNQLIEMIKTVSDADMMHDAIRGDVLVAINSGLTKNPQDIDLAKQDLEEHSQNLLSLIDKMEKYSNFPDEISSVLPSLKDKIVNYNKLAADLVNINQRMLQNEIVDKESASASVKFYQGFKELEDLLGSTSDKISVWIENNFDQVESDLRGDIKLLIALIIICIVIAVLNPLSLTVWVFRPLNKLVELMNALSDGNTNIDIPYKDKDDEIGIIAQALESFRQTSIQAANMLKAQKNDQQKKEVHQQRIDLLIKQFNSKALSAISRVSSSASNLHNTAEAMTRIAADTKYKAANVAQASKNTSQLVQNISGAADQMGDSIKDVSTQISKSTIVVKDAVRKADSADTTTQSLSLAANKINEVLGVISYIAKQINLLSLNATIESTRAQEGGRGFAVVAMEVKKLAKDTFRATEEISKLIQNIQSVSTEVINVIDSIKKSINNVNEYAGLISSAAEKQAEITRDITNNMVKATDSVKAITSDITDVTNAASSANSTANQVLEAARMLTKESEVLSGEINTFLANIQES